MRTPLAKESRRNLERAVIKARDIAEAAASAELERLGVGDAAAPGHLNGDERNLRNRLRVHGRQLGDRRRPDRGQSISHLATEVAYEHWHRMLFARFLAENHLLMYEDGVTPLSLTDCFDLADDETGDRTQGWQFAARFATRMLPQIFRVDSPVFELAFAPDQQRELENILNSVDTETFTSADALGWVYQFWQSKRKEAVNSSGVKIGGDELPAVTQLFTEPYMVSFLLDNSLGAWWAGKRLTAEDLAAATSEAELRKKAALRGVPLEYLRFVQTEDGSWTPASGTFDAWPDHLFDFKLLDPCCGSGHFLVAALQMLVPMRMETEQLEATDAIDVVLQENLYGLELDQRCVELAAFALALEAWRSPGSGYRALPTLHLACCGQSVGVAREEWKALAAGRNNLRIALDWMHEAFRHAPVLGSLINPAKSDAAKVVAWDELETVVTQAFSIGKNDEERETAVAAQGLARAATLLADQYHLVLTNVPYLARGKQCDPLRDFSDKHHPAAKNDLATVFLDRCLDFCTEGGTVSVVLPQNWLFLTSYRKFREKLLNNETWHLVARLGEGGFESSAAAGAFVSMLNISRGNAQAQSGALFQQDHGAQAIISGVDVSELRSAAEKSAGLVTSEVKRVGQAEQLGNPDARVALEQPSGVELLEVFSDCFAGVLNGDSPRFQKRFWELVERADVWTFQQTTVKDSQSFSGLELILYYHKKEGHLREDAVIRREKLHDSDRRGNRAWGKLGIGVSQMRSLPISIYTGETFDSNVAVIMPKEQRHLSAIFTFCNSAMYRDEVRRIDQKLNVTNATLAKVPFDPNYWTDVAEREYPKGLPEPYSNDPTQWIFHGHLCGSVIWDDATKWTADGPPRTDDTVLQIAVARLLGYRWPAELDNNMELAAEQREWVNRCEALLPLADDDGIVCLPAVRGEQPANIRLEAMLAAAYGDAWSTSIRAKLLEAVDAGGRSLDYWLQRKFFEQHCKLFQHRPFIWHIWDGRNDGFAALLNYHLLDRRNLERLIYTYLDDWIREQKQGKADGVDGANDRLIAAVQLKQQLEHILEGEAPYDIFVRWNPLEEQPIGWEPDLNDGVRLNIRPFMTATDVGKKGAGILRAKPNIHWKKDRGKDVASAPWYDLGPNYGENEGTRINDHHLALAEKSQAHDKPQTPIEKSDHGG